MVNAARAHALDPRPSGQDNPAKEVEDYRAACRELHRATQALSPSARKHLEDNRDVFSIPVEGGPSFLINKPSSPNMLERELFRLEHDHKRAFKTIPGAAARGCPRGSADERLILALRDAWDATPEYDPELDLEPGRSAPRKISWPRFCEFAILPSMHLPSNQKNIDRLLNRAKPRAGRI